MNFIGNIIWLLFGGIIVAIAWFIVGIILCVTIIGIPFGIQHFKFAKLGIIPFGARIY
ncbi:MAG TPA: YccF domain-containing protein [Clostridium sp.]